MSSLSMFFAQNASVDTEETVEVSYRFKDKDGKNVSWKIRSITEEENQECRKAATRKVKGKGGMYMPEMDTNEYLARLVVASVAFPNLKDAELLKSYGVMAAEKLVVKMLLPGEYAVLLEKVQAVNGFDQSVNDLKDEVKN
ncbi:phage portal protein [Paenibacillus sp. FJAT-26967]|uniref:phage tail assembly chaperone n=1 Tax=Paenibacillus sp. FJAT-26967 TaxID=1729690 RepID=UPI000837B560|nr:phage portal protein [Paenibacillus sp. FJAT-26967]